MADKKPKENKIPLKKAVLFARWDRIVNARPEEIRKIREENEDIGLDRAEAKQAGANVISGREASKKIEVMIRKAADFRGQYKRLPPFTDEEWGLLGSQIRLISRLKFNIGALEDDDGDMTPKHKALILWGYVPAKARGKFPDKNEVKAEVKGNLQD